MKTPPKLLEKAIQREICDWLFGQGYFFWRSNNMPVFSFGGRNNQGTPRFRSLPKYTPKGLPDIIIVYRGKFIGVEVKRVGNKLRPDQETFGKKIMDNSGIYLVVHSLIEMQKSLEAIVVTLRV